MKNYVIFCFILFTVFLTFLKTNASEGCFDMIVSPVNGIYFLGDETASEENPKCIKLNTEEEHCLTSYWVEIHHKSEDGKCYRYIYDELAYIFSDYLPDSKMNYIEKMDPLGEFELERGDEPLILEENCDESYEY